MARSSSNRNSAPTNAAIAELLSSFGRALQLSGDNPFKAKAYRRAAITIEEIDDDVVTLLERRESLQQFAGIGASIEAQIKEIIRSGALRSLVRIKEAMPDDLAELTKYPRLDPKVVKRAYKKLTVGTIAGLRKKLENGELVAKLGVKVAEHVRRGLMDHPPLLRRDAVRAAASIIREIRKIPGVMAVEQAGGLRRQLEIVDSLDLLILAANAKKIISALKKPYSLIESGEVTSFSAPGGLLVRAHIVAPALRGLGTVLSTGTPAHINELAALPKRAAKNLSLDRAAQWDGKSEEEVYSALGLPFIPAPLREGRGEIEAALGGELPTLVTRADICGDLHMHSTYSDGADTIEAMANAAKALGYRYIGITDHSKHLTIAGGLTEAELLSQIDQIEKLNAKLRGITIFKGSEVDILEDGSLDFPDRILKRLDYAICSIHSRFALDKKQQTSRILRAIDNRYCTFIGHATGRLLLKRPGYELDMEKVLQRAAKAGCFFEINSSPDRLDLNDVNVKRAKELGVKVAISTDAHSTRELGFMQGGVDQGQRGWLTKDDVVNTRDVEAVVKLLRARR